MEEQKLTHTSSIVLRKSMGKQDYGWDIRISNDNLKQVVGEINKINDLMIEKFMVNEE